MKKIFIVLMFLISVSVFSKANSLIDDKYIDEYSLSKEQEVYLNLMISRLKLTDNQNDQLMPIFLDIFQKRQSIMKKNGVDIKSRSSGERIGMKQLRSIKKEMDKLNKQTMKQLEKVLSKVQLNEYKKLQEEQRNEMRNRLRN
tara:strand:+ start:147 stop:575 length:429 start_codon:yes stop_codon:yes gene_type:complete